MTSNPETVTVRDLTGLLALVPTLVGFQPERSIVVCFLRGTRIALSMRADLDGANVRELAETAIMAATRAGASELIAVGYIPNISVVIHEVLRDLGIAIENETMDADQPLSVLALAAVGRDGWCELPMWGRDIPPLRPLAELTEHPVHVARIVAGMAPARSRAEMVARVKAGSDAPSEAFMDGWHSQCEQMAGMAGHEMASQLDELLTFYEQMPEGELPDQRSMGRMAALVNDGQARDVASLRVSTETSHRWVDLWATIARSTDDKAAILPLSLCALASWVRGDGALANAALDQAESLGDASDAGRAPLTRIVRSVLVNAIPPEHWTQFAREVKAAGLANLTSLATEEPGQRAS